MSVALSIIAIAAFLHAPVRRSTADSVWFRRTFARYDLTGDGRPDTLEVLATGHRVDSLRIELTIRSAGQVVYRDTWLSTYYFQYDGPIDSISEATKRATVFRDLRAILTESSFGRFDPSDGYGPDDGPQGSMAYSIAMGAAVDSLRKRGLTDDSIQKAAPRLAEQLKPDSTLMDRAWRALVRSRPLTFTYSTGGEATRSIAWSPLLKRFVAVSACC